MLFNVYTNKCFEYHKYRDMYMVYNHYITEISNLTDEVQALKNLVVVTNHIDKWRDVDQRIIMR